MDMQRPDPDQLLKQVERQEEEREKGKLKIFFGYAAGVGKTYAMLEAAQQLKGEGVDVVAGYIEPHARPETMALTRGLELLPALSVKHGGIVLREFDLDSALKREPEVMLVDELAHTNAPGCRHEKRYQDIRELLNAGINVYTTVNVQHLESLNDMIAGLTGVVVRERIPDSVFDDASQVELVDIEPEELMERLRQGRVYREEQASRAMENFFTLDNLVSLRETALRRMADRVNLVQEKTAVTAGKAQTGPMEHILICLSSSPSNEKVIRQAARMAVAFHGKFTAFYVETSGYAHMSAEDRRRLDWNIRLAEQLGAKTITSYGDDIVGQIAEYAAAARVTKLVLGRSYTKRGLFSVKESFADRLVRLAPQLEIFLIPDSYEKKYRRKEGREKGGKRNAEAGGYMYDLGMALLVLAAGTGIARLFQYFHFGESNLIMIYLMGVLVLSVLSRCRVTSVLYSAAVIFVFNFFFTAPFYTFKINDKGYLITFFVMFMVGVIGSGMTQKIKRFAREMAGKSYRTGVLLETSQELQKASGREEIARKTAGQLSKLLERNVHIYLGSPEQNREPVSAVIHQERAAIEGDEEFAVAVWTYRNNKHAGFSTTTLPGVKCLYMAVRNSDKVFAVVGIDMEDKQLSSFEKGMMSAVLNECAFALEKEELMSEQREAAVRLSREQLRANLLRSISHDLRTPLTSISGSAGVLIGNGDTLDDEQKNKLYKDIYDDSLWLINLVENLLSVTRIENGTMSLTLQPELMDDVIAESLRHVDRRAKEHIITVEEDDDMLMARMDAKLIMQVVVNLVDNAVKYTPAGSRIVISTKLKEGYIVTEVADGGEGIEEEHREKLFDLFYTAGQSADGRRGLGLGLALCKSIVEAHGGRIGVRDNMPHGTVFWFTLRAEEVKMP